MTVGTPLWYKPTGNPGPLAAIVVKVNDGTVNVVVFDSGDGLLTNQLGADIKHDVTVAQNYAAAEFGQCSWMSWGGGV